MLMALLPSQLRVAAKCLLVQRAHPLIYSHIRHRLRAHHHHHLDHSNPHRSFSQSSRREAAEDPESIIAQLQSSPLLKQIADKPEALKALHDFSVILKESDVQIPEDRSLSMMEMFKLASNPKFREGAKRVVEELKKAGIEINAENAFELFGVRKPSG